MTVQTSTNVASFIGNGVTQIFPIAFKFNNDTDLAVFLVNEATGFASLLTLNSGYTVRGEGDEEGGSITVLTPPAADQRLTVVRRVGILQLTDLRNQGKFFAEVHEDALDLLTMIAQQNATDLGLSLRVAETDPQPQRLPSAVQRAGLLLSFDEDGNPIAVAPTSDSSTALRLELAESAGSGKVGYNAGALNAITRTLQSKARDIPSAFDFLSADERVDIQSGAKQHDHTANFQKFLDAMRGFNDPEFRYGEVPGGDYNVTQLVLTDYENVVLDMKGARIYGIATSNLDSIVKMINAINFKIQGSWVLNGLDKLNYDCGLWSTTGPGDGVSVPVDGGSSLVRISGLKGYRLKEAVRLGAYNADVSIAETLVDDFMTRLCPMALRVAGSQTGVQVSNSILISDPGNFGAGIEEEAALKMEGGFCTVTGGKMLHLQSGYGALIRLSPCESANYGNQFPTATFDGVHVETAAYIAQIDNPRALPSPASGLANLAFSACQGYVGAIPADQPLILVDTPDFNGKIKGRANNFYSHVVPRTAANIACTNSTAQFTTDFDNGSFGTGCKHPIAGVLNGGPAIHPVGQVIYATNLAGQSIAAGATAALKWTEKAVGGMKPRYNNFYDPATGEFTVPYFSTSLRIRGSATFTTAPNSNARLRITRDGIEVAYKFVLAASDTGVDISFDADEVQPGTKFKVELVNPGTSAITFGSSGTDYLAISLATA